MTDDLIQDTWNPEDEIDASQEMGMTPTAGEFVVNVAEQKKSAKGPVMVHFECEALFDIDGMSGVRVHEYLNINNANTMVRNRDRKNYKRWLGVVLGRENGKLAEFVGKKFRGEAFEDGNDFKRVRKLERIEAGDQGAPTGAPIVADAGI